MATYARIKKSEPVPTGIVPAVCYAFVDLGVHDGFPDPKHKKVDRVWKACLLFETNDRRTQGVLAGERFTVAHIVTMSLHYKSKLRKILESWVGNMTDEQAERFDLDSLVGRCCTLTMVAKAKSDGNTFANIEAVSPPMPGFEKMSREYGAADIPDWLAKMKDEGVPAAIEWPEMEAPTPTEPMKDPGTLFGDETFVDDPLPAATK